MNIFPPKGYTIVTYLRKIPLQIARTYCFRAMHLASGIEGLERKTYEEALMDANAGNLYGLHNHR